MVRRQAALNGGKLGFDTAAPWSLDALRLLFSVPRAFGPLVEAWNIQHPGSSKALGQLCEQGLVAHQPGIIVDTRTGKVAEREGRAVVRWRATAAGRRMLAEFTEDERVFEEAYPRTGSSGRRGAVALLRAFDLDDYQARRGISATQAISMSGLETRLGRWWMQQFVESGYIVALETKLADVREVVPEHCRITKNLCKALDVALEGTTYEHLRAEFRVRRRRFLDDIDPARVGITGATDYDHDVESQKVVASILKSPNWAGGGVFSMEPRIILPVNDGSYPWEFSTTGKGTTFYQPDAEFRGIEDLSGRRVVRRYVVEYERFQSRRDAWGHIERFFGYMHTKAFRGELGALLFVVDTEARCRSYVQLIEAFADHIAEQPGLGVANPITLAVSSVEKVLGSIDPLNLREWSRIEIQPGADTENRPVLHPPESSPYDSYFGRG
jgi:hypothetical protein